MLLKFAEIEIETALFELHRDGALIDVEPLIFNLLVYFVKNPNTVLSRDQLIDAVWSGRTVSEATVSGAIKGARQAIGDDGKQQKYIKTVHGRGFRFVVDVDMGSNQANNQLPPPLTNQPLIKAIEPSLIIFPFKQLINDTQARELSEEIVSDLEIILARVPLIKISAQGEHYATALISDIQQLFHKTGIRYILQGRIKCQGEQFKLNIQLSDAKTGFSLWAEKFVRPLQESKLLVTDILAKLEPKLNRAIFDIVSKSSEQPSAKQLYLKASSLLALKGWHQKTFVEAVDLLRKSERLDADFALTPAYLSLVLALGHRVGLIGDREKTKIEAIDAAERALHMENMDSTILGFVGCAFADVGMVARSIPILKNAIQQHSTNAQAWVALGSAYVLQNDFEQGIKYLSHGIDISPLDSRLSVWGAILSLAFLNSKKLAKAQEQAELACQRDDNSYLPRVVLATIQLCRRQEKSARITLVEAYRIKQDLSEMEIKSLVGKEYCQQLLALHNVH